MRLAKVKAWLGRITTSFTGGEDYWNLKLMCKVITGGAMKGLLIIISAQKDILKKKGGRTPPRHILDKHKFTMEQDPIELTTTRFHISTLGSYLYTEGSDVYLR